MFGLPTPNLVYLASEPAGMRKQHDALWALAETKLKENPFGGALFVFTNKSRDRVKALLGRLRLVGLREAPRKRPVQLAAGWRRREDLDHPGGAHDAARRHRAEGRLPQGMVRAVIFSKIGLKPMHP